MEKASKEQMKRINSLNLSPPAGSEVPESDIQLSHSRRSRRTSEKQIEKIEKYMQELKQKQQQQQNTSTTTEQEEAQPTERRIVDPGVPEVRSEEAARRNE